MTDSPHGYGAPAVTRDWKKVLEKLDDYRWLLPQDYKKGMLVPGLIFASEEMLDVPSLDEAIEQVANVAFLPGIAGYSMAMPDMHPGYGFPIGGVAPPVLRTVLYRRLAWGSTSTVGQGCCARTSMRPTSRRG